MAELISEIKVSKSGQLDIPIQLRDQLDLRPGDRLAVRVEQNKLIFEKVETVIKRLQQRFAPLKGEGVIEELIAERRNEAKKEL